MRSATTVMTMAALALTAWAHAEQPNAEALLEGVIDTLEAAESARVEGNTYSSISMGEGMPPMDVGGSFTILMARPDRYRIEWEQALGGMVMNHGAVWNAGGAPVMYMGVNNSRFPMQDNEMALAAATGVSGGAAHMIPGAFFDFGVAMPSPLRMLHGITYDGEEEVEGIACHRLKAASAVSAEHTLWIEKDRPVLRRVQYELGPGMLDEFEDESIEEQLEAAGLEDTEENREMVQGMLEMQREMMAHISGHLGQTFTTFELGVTIEDGAFAFETPEDAAEHDSLWDSVADAGGGEGGPSSYNDKFAVGDTAPDFEGPAVDGETIKLSDYRGQVVLIDFWATWCGPCIAVLPGLIEAYGEYHEDGFEIIGVSLDFEREALERFLDEREGMHWPNIYEEVEGSEIADEYGVHAIPFTLLLDREGVIRHRDLHGARLKEAIAELLATGKDQPES